MQDKDWIDAIIGTKTDQTLYNEIIAFFEKLSKNELPEDPSEITRRFEAFAAENFSCGKKSESHPCDTCGTNIKSLDQIVERYDELRKKQKADAPNMELDTALKNLFSDWMGMHILCITKGKKL